jgi:hypothetical protein
MERSGLTVVMDLDGPQGMPLSDGDLMALFARQVLPNVQAMIMHQERSRDWAGTIGGGVGNGGPYGTGSITYSWKAVSREGSATVNGGVGAGGNWNVGGSVTIRF